MIATTTKKKEIKVKKFTKILKIFLRYNIET
jgi:hypothetical protein